MFTANDEQKCTITAVANRITNHVCDTEADTPLGLVLAGMCAAFVAEASAHGVSLDDMVATVRALHPAIKASFDAAAQGVDNG